MRFKISIYGNGIIQIEQNFSKMKFNRKSHVIGLIQRKPVDLHLRLNRQTKYQKYIPNKSKEKKTKQIRTHSVDKIRKPQGSSDQSSDFFNLFRNNSEPKVAKNEINPLFFDADQIELNLNPFKLNFKRKVQKTDRKNHSKQQVKIAKILKQLQSYTKQLKAFIYDINHFMMEIRKLFSSFASAQISQTFSSLEKKVTKKMNMFIDKENQLLPSTKKLKQRKTSYFDNFETKKQIELVRYQNSFSGSVMKYVGKTQKKTVLQEVAEVVSTSQITQKYNETRGSTPESRQGCQQKITKGNFKNFNKALVNMKDILTND